MTAATVAPWHAYTSPNGVDHAITPAGWCVTCGRAHIDWTHLTTVNSRNLGPCHVTRADWPYECRAKDMHPDHTVYACATHGVWWHRQD